MAIIQLRSSIIQANNRDLRRQSIRSLHQITEPDRFISETEPLLTRAQVLPDVPLILDLYAENGNAEKAVAIADDLGDGDMPLSVRLDLIRLIVQYDRSPDSVQPTPPGPLHRS